MFWKKLTIQVRGKSPMVFVGRIERCGTQLCAVRSEENEVVFHYRPDDVVSLIEEDAEELSFA